MKLPWNKTIADFSDEEIKKEYQEREQQIKKAEAYQKLRDFADSITRAARRGHVTFERVADESTATRVVYKVTFAIVRR